MDWIESAGGPLVLVPQGARSVWPGDAEHYHRACSVDQYADVLEVEGIEVLVLNDEPLRTAVWQGEGCLYLVRWRYAPSETAVVRSLASLDESLCESVEEVRWQVPADEMVILDAAESGLEATLQLSFAVPSGLSRVRTFLFNPSREIGLVVHAIEAGAIGGV